MDADGNVRLYVVEYLGFTPMDKRFSKPMLPWVVAEIRRRGSTDTVCVGVERGKLHAYHGSELVFSHSLSLFTRYGYVHGDYRSFMYVLRDPSTPQILTCHLFRAEDPSDVVELFSAMREQSKDSMAAVKERSLSSAAALSCEISLNTSHYFEVLYIGRIKITHKKVPESFIDDALEKFHMHEAEKEKLKSQKICNSHANQHHGSAADLPLNKDESTTQETGSAENLISTTSTSVIPTSSNSPAGSVEVLPTNGEHNADNKVGGGSEHQVTIATASQKQTKQLPQMEPMRSRAASTGSARELKRSESSAVSNRTMLFLVGRMDLRLISPDRKQTVLHKHLKDVAYCIQGIKNSEHFGFICSEANVDHYVAYVFKCQSASVADDVVGAITQAFLATSEAQRREKLPVYSCDHCPMMWYHKLCTEVDGHTDRVVQTIIMRRLEALSQSEQESILAKYHGVETQGLRDQNEFLMMLLRAHCENKQARHIHDTAENRHEFLNQYLGGSTIFMKAKRSLTNSFDHLLKRKGSRDDFGPILKEMSLPMNAALCKDGISTEQHIPVTASTEGAEESESKTTSRPRASTISSSEFRLPTNLIAHQKESPMKNIFMKVGNSPLTPVKPNQDISRQSGSWRQVIFKSVTPNKVRPDGSCDDPNNQLPRVKRDASELRALWRKAINQQLLLIRMDKENARLQARQEEATVKRIKLEYDEISIYAREVVEVWDVLVSREASASRCDRQLLLHAIKQGVPRTKRGEVWQFLADQHCFNTAPPDITKFPNYNVPYDNLLKQLTSHQHAILIDLGRTFPNHPYYSSPLGPGQLALFNILKAYSLLDPEVGYCQGLSFVAGVLLLHMPEENTFLLLKHLMLRRGMRRQYLPNMGALQVQLYQMSRLLHDQFPDLYSHFDTHDVAPTLYAAPWVLTLFASQFPLGFVTRVFDLLFFDSGEAVFRVALALFSEHKKEILLCQSFEEIMDYLKNQIPNIDKDTLDHIMKQVFPMDISKQLHEYEVEYHVLKEESNVPHADIETLQRVEAENRHLTEQLEISTNNSHRLQTCVSKLEGQVRSLEVTVAALGSFIIHLADSKPDTEIPDDIRRIISHLANAETRKVMNMSQGTNKSLSETAESATISNFPEKSSSVGSELQILSIRQHKGAPYPLKSALSSPNLSAKLTGISNMFSNSQNNKQIKSVGTDMPIHSSKTNAACISHSNGNLKSDSSCKIESCKNDTENCVPKYRLKSSQSSFELISNKSAIDESGDSGNVTPTSPSCQVHPLDSCLGVNFSYSGTTKLKTIRPLRSNLARNTSCDNLMPLKPIDSTRDTNPSTQKDQQSLAYVMGQTNNNLLTR